MSRAKQETLLLEERIEKIRKRNEEIKRRHLVSPVYPHKFIARLYVLVLMQWLAPVCKLLYSVCTLAMSFCIAIFNVCVCYMLRLV
jgi:hypothetical protein